MTFPPIFHQHDATSLLVDAGAKIRLNPSRLPNTACIHSRFGLPFAASKGGAEFGHIRQRIVDAIFWVRGGTGKYDLSNQFGPVFAAPAEREGQKEALPRSQSICFFLVEVPALAGQSILQAP